MPDILKLRVDTQKHENSADVDNPDNGDRSFGFRVNATLTLNRDVASTLQETYRLEQWVKDSSWQQSRADATNNAEHSTWIDEAELNRDWERDEFGEIEDRGEWNSTKNQTRFQDEPGFLGDTKLSNLYRLGNYSVTFKWKVFNGDALLLETEEFTFEADPDDNGNVTYVIPNSKTWPDINV